MFHHHTPEGCHTTNAELYARMHTTKENTMTARVIELGTNNVFTYAGITPYQAVISAYAQSLGDYNTWQYDKKYAPLVKVGKYGVHLDRFSCPF